MLGDDRYADSFDKLLPLLKDSSLRVRHLAAISIGKLGRPQAIPAGSGNAARERQQRRGRCGNSGVMALVGCGDTGALLAAADDSSSAVRIGVLLALRRLENPAMAKFLHDPDPRLVLEAARAIHDLPLDSAMPELAQLISQTAIASNATKDAISKEFDGRDALLRRVLNANFRLGTAENAAAVARFAARADVPEAMRIEALEMLAAWEKPSGHDRVINAWRPLEPRAADIAVAALAAGARRNLFRKQSSAASRRQGRGPTGDQGSRSRVGGNGGRHEPAGGSSRSGDGGAGSIARRTHQRRNHRRVERLGAGRAQRIAENPGDFPSGRGHRSIARGTRQGNSGRAAGGPRHARHDQSPASRRNFRKSLRQTAGRPSAARAAT